MKIEKNRHLLILDALFSNESKITAEKLALISRSSVRTIKSDLVYLKKQLAEEGIADLISFRGKGYQIKPIDKERYDKLSVDVEAMKRIYYNRAIEETDRRLYIIQRILTEEHILIDDVCESLFVSRSSISKDMERIISFLKTYDISVKPIPGKGLVIEGNETDIRNAMVELHCSQYHDHQQLYPYEPFNKLFYKDRQVYEDLRHAMLRIIRDTEITISDLASKRIPTYLCLVKSRIESGKLIAFDRLVREELLNTYDYRIARQICEDETVRRIVELPEEEIINLARLLLISRDIDMRSKGISNVLLPYVEENTILYNKVLKKSKRKLGKSLYNVEFYRFIELDVQSLQLQLYLKHHFDTTRQKKLITYIERDESLLSPVPLEMARIMVSYLQDEFGEDISETIVTAYAAYYELIMKRIVYPYRKMRLLITATEGLVYSQNLKENLIRKYGDYISDAEVYNLYEMRKLDFNNYDAVVHSGNLMYYAYPLKSIGYDEIDYRKDDDRKMKEFFNTGYDRSRISEIKKILQIHKGMAIDNLDFFIESLFYRYSSCDEDQKALCDDYYRKRRIIDYYSAIQRSVLLMVDHGYTGREFIDIFIPKEPARYHGLLETRFIIVACLDPDNEVSSLKVDNYVLQYISKADGIIEKLAEDKDGTLDEVYDQIIE